MSLRAVLYAACVASRLASAFPQGLEVTAIITTQDVLPALSTSTVLDEVLRLQKKAEVLTAHKEQSNTILQLPTATSTSQTTPQITTSSTLQSTPEATSTPATIQYDSTTSLSGRAHAQPATVHQESSEAVLQAPSTTALQAPTTPAQAQPVTAQEQSTTQEQYASTTQEQFSSTGQVTVYLPPVETSMAQLQTPSSTPDAYTPPVVYSPLPTTRAAESPVTIAAVSSAAVQTVVSSSPGAIMPLQPYTSVGAAHMTTAPTLAAASGMPTVLHSSQSGAIGLVAGSAPVTIGSMTYSLAAGGSAIYINGVSSSLLSFGNTAWSSSGAVHTSSVMAGPIASTGVSATSKPSASASQPTTTASATTMSTMTTTSTSVSSATSKPAGSGNALVPCIWTSIFSALALLVFI